MVNEAVNVRAWHLQGECHCSNANIVRPEEPEITFEKIFAEHFADPLVLHLFAVQKNRWTISF